MLTLWKGLGFPTTLKDFGATPAHLYKMIRAAKNPQLKMKLNQMPIPMDVERGDIDRLIRPTLEAAFTGDLNLIPKMVTPQLWVFFSPFGKGGKRGILKLS
jgi:alcohol dehydrogenase